MARSPRRWIVASLGLAVLAIAPVMVGRAQAPKGPAPQALAVSGIADDDGVPDIIVSPWRGVAATRILDGASGTEVAAGAPFGAFAGGVRAAAGDVTGDGVVDVVLAMGPGGGLVALVDGSTKRMIGSGYPFGAAFVGGVSVAVADSNGDGRDDIFIAPASGGGTVAALDGRTYAPLFTATPFGSAYTGGLHVAAGDVDGDGKADVFVGQAAGGGVALVNGATAAVMLSTVAYGGADGVFVAMGDVTGDGVCELIAAPGSGTGPVYVYEVGTAAVIATLAPFPATFAGGVRVAASDVTGDGRADIFTAPGPGLAPTVRVFDGASFAVLREYPALDPSFTAGVFIAAPAFLGSRLDAPTEATFEVGVQRDVVMRLLGGLRGATATLSGNLPAGVTFSFANDAGVLAGIPAAGTGGTYPVTVTASRNGAPVLAQPMVLTVLDAPAITSAATTTFAVGSAGTFTLRSTGFPLPALSVAGALPAGVTFTRHNDGTATLAGTATAAGTYPLTLTAANQLGLTATQAFVLTVTADPVFTSASAATFTVGGANTFAITTSGTPAGTSIVSAGALPSGVTFTSHGNGTATLAGTPAEGTGGQYVLSLTARNAAGAASTQTLTLTVQQAPALTSAAPAIWIPQIVPVVFVVQATGFPRPRLTVAGALPTGVTFVDNGDGSGTFAGIPSFESTGYYPVTIAADNGVGASATTVLSVNVTSGPSFLGAGAHTFVSGQAGSFLITTTAVPPVVSVRHTTGATLPNGLAFTDHGDGTATIAGTPISTQGTFVVSVTATNAVGMTTRSFELTVHEPAAIRSATSASFQEGQPGSIGVFTSGYPRPVLTMTGALPPGVLFDPDGVISGIPIVGSAGVYRVTFRADNGVGDPVERGLELTVHPGTVTPSFDVDGPGKGAYSSIAIGVDGLPIISHLDQDVGGLRVTHCNDDACSSATSTTFDDGANAVGLYTDIAIGTDGLPVISHYDSTTKAVRVTHCSNVACTIASTATLDAGHVPGPGTSIAIGADGLPVVSYPFQRADGLLRLRVTQCSDVACTSGTSVTIDGNYPPPSGPYRMLTGLNPSMAIGADGLPVISHSAHSGNSGHVFVTHCDDAACSSSTSSSPGSFEPGLYVTQPSLVIGSDGFPLIGWQSLGQIPAVLLAHCQDAACTSATHGSAASGPVSRSPAIAIGANGRPVISHTDLVHRGLRMTYCGDVGCTTAAASFLLDLPVNSLGMGVGVGPSLVIGADGRPIISHYNATATTLRVTKCTTAACQ